VDQRHVPSSMTIAGSRTQTGPLSLHVTGGSFLNFLHDTAETERADTP
jgi:hypothetical protein